jgi:hypothetical protein
MLQVLVSISLESFVAKRDMGLCKSMKEKMDTKMSGILKTMGTKMPA